MSKNKCWVVGFVILSLLSLSIISLYVIKVDPFFHYHKPNTNYYYYELNNERSQNDGIIKKFDYQAMITGTSVTENFKTTEAEKIFGLDFIKVPFSGASYKEINNNVRIALSNNPNLKIVIRGLDMSRFFDEKDTMCDGLGEFPTYLYDDNLLNDVKYLFNRDIVFKRVYKMIKDNNRANFKGGITSFDEYANWMDKYKFGVNSLFPNGVQFSGNKPYIEISEEEIKRIRENIYQNLIQSAAQYPEVEFYCFFTPYSVAWWKPLVEYGTIKRQIQAEQVIIEEILKCKNIRLFSFNCETDITTDLNNYKDSTHYAEWINSLILKNMQKGQGIITESNYKQYLDDEMSLYEHFNYYSLNYQEDYENDYYADALLNSKIYKISPYKIDIKTSRIKNAYISEEGYKNPIGIKCVGSLQRDIGTTEAISDYLMHTDYIGFECQVNNVDWYKYIEFYGKKILDHGQPSVYIYDTDNNLVGSFSVKYEDIDNEWHQYLIDISDIKGDIKIVFNGGYIDSTGNETSEYVFSDVTLY